MNDFVDRSEFEQQFSALRAWLSGEMLLRRRLAAEVADLTRRLDAITTERDDVLARAAFVEHSVEVVALADHFWKVGDLAHVIEERRDDEAVPTIVAAFLDAASRDLEFDRLCLMRNPANCDLPQLVRTCGTVKRLDVAVNTVLELDSFLIV